MCSATSANMHYMKIPKIVYVLVSSPNDIYLEQAYVSIESVRVHMPNAEISVLVDEATKSTLVGERATRLSKADNIICVGLLDGFTPQERSRIIKTSARKYITGDFIFIDTDTIVCKPFVDVDCIPYDIAACEDSHSVFKENPYRNMCIAHGKLLGWPIETVTTYYNSGVIFVKDTPRAHEFYHRWHLNWLDGRKLGVRMDQPSFAKTNYEMNDMVGTLSNIWNCEILHGIKFMKDAYIVHYLCTNKSTKDDTPIFILKDYRTFEKIKATNKIPTEVQQCFMNPFLGLPNLTLLLSGRELQAFNDELVQFALRNAGTKKSKVILNLITILSRIKYWFSSNK